MLKSCEIMNYAYVINGIFINSYKLIEKFVRGIEDNEEFDIEHMFEVKNRKYGMEVDISNEVFLNKKIKNVTSVFKQMYEFREINYNKLYENKIFILHFNKYYDSDDLNYDLINNSDTDVFFVCDCDNYSFIKYADKNNTVKSNREQIEKMKNIKVDYDDIYYNMDDNNKLFLNILTSNVLLGQIQKLILTDEEIVNNIIIDNKGIIKPFF